MFRKWPIHNQWVAEPGQELTESVANSVVAFFGAALSDQVFCFFFRAEGKSTLLRISL
jgi:hypothetical protein